MSDTAPSPAPRARRPRLARRLLTAAAVALVLLLVALTALYAARREAARHALIGWLERRGIEADIQIERLEIDQLIARVTVGDPADPDFAVERVEVDYALTLPWSETGLGATPSRIRLVRPVLRARWSQGAFSLGALDPLVEEFTGRPPGPEARGPVVVVEDGRLRLQTDYGLLEARADARVEDGRLMRLNASAAAAELRSGDDAVDLERAALNLVTTGERTRFDLTLSAGRAALGDVTATALDLSLSGAAPYPDLEARRSEGALTLEARATAEAFAADGLDAAGLDAAVSFDGRLLGWLETFELSGVAGLEAQAQTLAASGSRLDGARVSLSDAAAEATRRSGALRWGLTGAAQAGAARIRSGDLTLSQAAFRTDRLAAGGRAGRGAAAFEAAGPLAVSVQALDFGDLNLTGVSGRLDADLVSDGGLRLTAGGALAARRGSWPLLGAATADDAAEMRALKTALGAFALDAPDVRLALDGSGTRVVLAQPADVRPANGGRVLVSAHPAGPLYAAPAGASGGGALTLEASGREGPPQIRVEIPAWRLTGDGFTARLEAGGAFDFDFIRGAEVQTRGLLTSGGGRLTYAPDGCVAVTAAQLAFGENDARDLSGAFCPPAQGPMLTVQDGAWRADGRLEDVAAAVPFLAMRFDRTDGALAVAGGPDGVALDARIAAARVSDAADPLRFHPLGASGGARLADDNWTGRFDLTSGPHRLGSVALSHNGRSESGGVIFDASELVFAEGGLQPDDLTPLTGGLVQSPVQGRAGFEGRFDWTPEGATSSGTLDVARLDFVSPAGAVTGLSGTVAFTSLTPLRTAPGQRLTAESLAALTPLSELELVFELGEEAVRVSGADLDVAGGHVRIEPFEAPLDPAQGFAATLVFNDVQLGQLIAGSGFGEQVSLDAVVTGRVPVVYEPSRGWRVVDGSLYAVRPGRLEIARTALDDLEAGGGGEGVPPNVVQDLAYQAMEDLAFDVLTAEVNSLDEGRLGVLFRIRGRHDPPQDQELRLTLQELISRQFLNRELPLPSGTEIDLTLDTTLNANQLISDFLALQRARRGEADPESEPVQE